MRKLCAQRLVLMLGGILLIIAVLVGGAANADAQGQGQAKDKAQGQSQGKGKAQSQIQDQAQGGDEGEGDSEDSGDQDKVTVCHAPPGNPDNAHEITVSQSAADAHLFHHLDDTEGACGEASTGDTGTGDTGTGDTGNDLVGLEGTISNNVLSFPATDCTVAQDASLTAQQNGSKETTLTNGEGGVKIKNGSTALEVSGYPNSLSGNQPITVTSSNGVDCTNVMLTGTLAKTSSGGVALKTEGGSKGDKAVVPLVTETKAQGERLQKLAGDKKLGKVDVTGVKVKKDAKTKDVKAKDTKTKDAQAKGQERKDALKVTSLKKTNKK